MPRDCHFCPSSPENFKALSKSTALSSLTVDPGELLNKEKGEVAMVGVTKTSYKLTFLHPNLSCFDPFLPFVNFGDKNRWLISIFATPLWMPTLK